MDFNIFNAIFTIMSMPSISEMPYRMGANAFLINSSNEILIVQKCSYKDNEWDLPGGGFENDESPTEGITRELKEELGDINFEIISQSQYINRYEWSEDNIISGFAKRNKWYRGQEKVQFLVKFLGNKEDLVFQASEIKDHNWINPSDLKDYLIFPNQFEIAQRALLEFGII